MYYIYADSVLWEASMTERYRARPQTAEAQILIPVSGEQCRFIHLTILRRFSWPSFAYMSQRWPKTPLIPSFLHSFIHSFIHIYIYFCSLYYRMANLNWLQHIIRIIWAPIMTILVLQFYVFMYDISKVMRHNLKCVIIRIIQFGASWVNSRLISWVKLLQSIEIRTF